MRVTAPNKHAYRDGPDGYEAHRLKNLRTMVAKPAGYLEVLLSSDVNGVDDYDIRTVHIWVGKQYDDALMSVNDVDFLQHDHTFAAWTATSAFEDDVFNVKMAERQDKKDSFAATALLLWTRCHNLSPVLCLTWV